MNIKRNEKGIRKRRTNIDGMNIGTKRGDCPPNDLPFFFEVYIGWRLQVIKPRPSQIFRHD